MAFSYSKARFSLRPSRPAIPAGGGQPAQPAVQALCRAQRKSGPQRDNRQPSPELVALTTKLVEWAYDGAPPRDAMVEVHCCDEHGDLPGMPYPRVWSDTRSPERARAFCAWEGFVDEREGVADEDRVQAGPLTLEECFELHDLLAPIAEAVDCGEEDERPALTPPGPDGEARAQRVRRRLEEMDP